jgi:hypothetical protein
MVVNMSHEKSRLLGALRSLTEGDQAVGTDRKDLKKRLRWANGRAVFRLPETTDEQLDQLNVLRTEEERAAFNIALRGVLAELADPAVRNERMQRAKDYDRRNAAGTLARAALGLQQGILTQETFNSSFLSNNILYSPLLNELSEGAPFDIVEGGDREVVYIYSSLDLLQKESPDSLYIESVGRNFLKAQIDHAYTLVLDRGEPHAAELPPLAEASQAAKPHDSR